MSFVRRLALGLLTVALLASAAVAAGHTMRNQSGPGLRRGTARFAVLGGSAGDAVPQGGGAQEHYGNHGHGGHFVHSSTHAGHPA